MCAYTYNIYIYIYMGRSRRFRVASFHTRVHRRTPDYIWQNERQVKGLIRNHTIWKKEAAMLSP